ncbi:hypothetical protein FWK35_00030641 [Aphis craccivora]|uniref:Uncharacterized protein n=1 Tax=Aphis craccivora TaxID=307492 RepID=A0A6G0XL87_APHCR|nr:hypothetical protein FWK35_00030641 [Aphis craccivora]
MMRVFIYFFCVSVARSWSSKSVSILKIGPCF